MLSHSDRQQKFKQLRARWEAAESGKDANMPGRRREKQTTHQTANGEPQNTAGSKFRRKLSHGLALISLTQRKASSDASLAVSALSTTDSATAVLDHVALLSPQTDSALSDTSNDLPHASQDSARASEDLLSVKQLPRSRTFSYIPRLVKTDIEAQSATELDEAVEPTLDTAMTNPQTLPLSRIPTPNPLQSRRRGSSPRQYLPHNPQLQTKKATNRQSLASIIDGSPSKAAVRSRTTPNLVKVANTSQSASYMAPRRPGLKRSFASSTPQKPVLVENVPTNKRVVQRRSQLQDKAIKGEILPMPSATTDRKSFGPGASFVQSKRLSFVTPSTSTKRISSHLTQAPVTARRSSPERQEASRVIDSPHPPEVSSIAQSRLMGLNSPPTPTPSTVDLTDLFPPPSPLTIDNDTQRRTLGTPNGLGGIWRSSKGFAAANHQVRRLPRSSTFHHFGRRWEAPPVPSIPQEYKSPSSSKPLHSAPYQYISSSLSNLHRRCPVSSKELGLSSSLLLLGIASAQTSSEVEASKSSSDFKSVTLSDVTESSERAQRTNEELDLPSPQGASLESQPRPCDDAIRSKISFTCSSNVTALPPITTGSYPKHTKPSTSIARSQKTTGHLHIQRRWSISERFYPDSANNATCVQVKDYMPPLYWAGRFQSRFDQWRTDAMVMVLDCEYKPEDESPLRQCNLDDEKKAIILIFMQLRDLCASSQAADSLQVRRFSSAAIVSELR